MGVFSWFRRKPVASAEASDQEAAVTTVTAEPPAGAPSDSTDGAPDESVADSPLGSTDDEASGASEAAGGPLGGGTVAAGIDIPKQQSAEEAADSETGESARK